MNRDSFLSFSDKEVKAVVIKDQTFYVRSLGGVEYAKFVDSLAENLEADKDKELSENIEKLAKVVIVCLCDEKGNQILSLDDVEAVKEKSIQTLKLISDAALEVNGLTINQVETDQKN